MNYQDQLIKDLVNELELSIINYHDQPNLSNAQKVAEAKHKLMELLGVEEKLNNINEVSTNG